MAIPGNVGTLNKGKATYITDVSDPNQLFKYASYNVLFTLSALSQSDLENLKTLLTAKPHDIIIRSAGIGPNANRKGGSPGQDTLTPENRKIVDSNEEMKKALDKSQLEFQKNNDMYFRNVMVNSLPGLNEKRRLTSVTHIEMEIIEPWGITLLERVRAAAANNNYLDHLDAPYLLTIDFAGVDEFNNAMPNDVKNSLKRVIPIKLVNMELEVNQAGTTYTVTAIPYNEFPYVDRYNYVRTTGSIVPTNKTLGAVVDELEKILNKQTEDEKGINEYPDTYEISIDKFFKPDTTRLNIESLQQLAMYSQSYDAGVGDEVPEFMKIVAGNSIIKILEEIMKTHPMVSDDKYKDWVSIVERKFGAAESKGGASEVFKMYMQKGNDADMHYDYYRIRASIIPIQQYDHKRKTNVKHIKYVIEPYKIHAYSLAIPGVSTGQNFKNFVHKTYNYIFTGENVDILDFNIQYKVAYFTAQLKNVDSSKKNKADPLHVEKTASIEPIEEPVEDQTFILKSEAGMAQSGGTGRTIGGTTAFDQFLDYLTHPQADMIVLRLEILGDPAWISQSQFIPANPFKIATGTSEDKDIGVFRGDKNHIWNDKLRCYNTEFAEPIVLLNYRMPTDINDKRGTYELQNTQSATFSGLYRVYQVEHNFNEGKYTNVLHMVRFNNQGISISNPYTEYKVYRNNGETYIGTQKEITTLKLKGLTIDNIIDIGRTKINAKINEFGKSIKKTLSKITKGFI